MRISLATFVIALACGAASAEESRTPAFPGAEGFGAHTQGGRGGKVLFVTNPNDSGPGSLRAAIEAEGPRIIVFRVGGTIELKSDLKVRKPFITIAGQTAPGGGVCLKGFALNIGDTREVIVRHLRVRPGDVSKKEMDCISVGNSENVILDHCSASWGIDETLSVTGNTTKNVTVQWCIISESLNNSVHKKGAHGYGSLIVGDDGGYTFHHNLYAHHNSRNPRPGGHENTPGIVLDFRNNVIYNWGMNCGYTSQTPVKINYVKNYLRRGPSAWESARDFAFQPGGLATRLFMAENVFEQLPEKTKDNRLLLKPGKEVTQETMLQCLVEKPFDAPALAKDETAEEAFARVLAEAGATLPARDAADARVIESVRKGTGKIIDSQTEVGGWPDLAPGEAPKDSDNDGMPDDWETKAGLNPNDPADAAGDLDKDGYTNVEEWINDIPNARDARESRKF